MNFAVSSLFWQFGDKKGENNHRRRRQKVSRTEKEASRKVSRAENWKLWTMINCDDWLTYAWSLTIRLTIWTMACNIWLTLITDKLEWCWNIGYIRMWIEMWIEIWMYECECAWKCEIWCDIDWILLILNHVDKFDILNEWIVW